jgi:dTDP-4-dehydrorhamnose reductase
VRWLVTGAGGQLGSRVVATLHRTRPDDEVTAATRDVLDVRDHEKVRALVPGHDVVVSCAAYTDVDGAQDRGPGAAQAVAVNVDGVGALALAARAGGARLVHVSTDYVLDGAARTPYREDAQPAPLQTYGASKLAGEVLVLDAGGCVVRTAWLHDGRVTRSFVATMVERAAAGARSTVVADQVGQPTWVVPLAERLVELGLAADADGAPPGGVLHLAGAGAASRFDQARAVYTLCGADPDLVEATTSAELAARAAAEGRAVAPRPPYSVLADTRSATYGLPPMPGWDAMLAASLADGPDRPAGPAGP